MTDLDQLRPAGCTGAVNPDLSVSHDAETCPVHEDPAAPVPADLTAELN